MKSTLLLIVLATLAQLSYGQKNTTILFEKIVHDFGVINEENGPVSFDFTFKNTGKEPFIIEKAEPDCGCTSPAFSKEPVKSGKTGFIRATFDPKNQDGTFTKKITVSGNNAEGKVYLTITGKVVPRPRSIMDDYPAALGTLRFKVNHVVFGDIYRNNIDTQIMSVYNPGDKAIIINFVQTPEHLRVEKTPITIKPKEKIDIEVYYSSFLKTDLGYSFDRIYLHTDDVLMPEKEIIVVANILVNYKKLTEEEIANAPKIVFDSKDYDFGKMNQGQVKTCEFKYKNSGKDQLVIYDTKTSCGCTAMTMGKDRLEPGEESIIKVTFDSKGKEGTVLQSVTVKTNDPDNPEIYLNLRAVVQKVVSP